MELARRWVAMTGIALAAASPGVGQSTTRASVDSSGVQGDLESFALGGARRSNP